MIEFPCDRCEKTLDAPNDKAGTKIECPHCSDINVVPEEKTAPAEADARLLAMGLPPDSGVEQRVLVVRPSIWRGSPFRSFALLLLPIGGPIALYLLLGQLGEGVQSGRGKATWWAFLIVAALSWGWLGIWWVITALGRSIEITNKRTMERRGIVRRATSEVLHDHVRNIQINQSVMNRIMNVGRIGISSSGQDGIEIEMRDLPKPDRLKEVIDAYRPM